MNIKLLGGALGAEIEGINLKDTSTDNFNLINKLLLEHKVLFFRDQNISPEEQISLAKHLNIFFASPILQAKIDQVTKRSKTKIENKN